MRKLVCLIFGHDWWDMSSEIKSAPMGRRFKLINQECQWCGEKRTIRKELSNK